ncbi:uncharacterized protein HD556DRAFT_1451726 [Suillus plorans]|uniref:Uncharacterized protein n=1 Tax=Suillus plorans TaxID=116603 RepID=A0A9P7A8R8_9AGAM|nr:uncharacterized protein HD556DRAFT_1451726 [Suillus plorans]KAG1784493.1 hypothetical protein HD556DRAFT_1451726 [Suillus plorans]
MVAMCPSNKSKHLGKVDLPAKRQKYAEDSDDEDNVKKCQPVRKKPAPRRHQKAKKAAATKAIAQFELEMKEKDAQDSLQANCPPTLNVSKVPRKPSVSVLGDPADETIIEDVMLIDNDQNNENGVQNSENLPGSYKPGTKFTKAQKVCRDVEAAKQRAVEQQKGRAESKEDEEVMDSGDDNVRGVGKKQQKGSHTCSDRERPSSKRLKQDDLLFSSQPPQSGMVNNWCQVISTQVPNHNRQPSAAPKSVLAASGTDSLASRNTVRPGGFEVELNDDEQPEPPGPHQGEQDPLLTRIEVIKAGTEGREQAGGGSDETDMRESEDMHYGGEQDDGSSPKPESARPYMWKLKVVSHTITCPPPERQGSATNSMQTGRLKTSYSKSNECRNDRTTGRQKQQGKNNATSCKSVTNAPWSMHNNSEDNDDNNNNNNNNNNSSSSSDNESSQAPHTRVKFMKNDLPPGLHCDFDALVVPMWIDFISTLDNMWDISDFADEMQRIWDLALPAIKHTVSKLKDPVYKILMQRAYHYCSDFGERAKIVIAKYIKEQGWMSDEIQQVVAYIVPEQIPWVNKKGQKNYYGAFEDQCILDMFALYFKHVHCLPTKYCSERMPKGALSITTVTVKQTWKMWKTGHFVQPTKASQCQFAEGLWSYSTELIMESIDGATRHKWKKIFKGAAPFTDAHRK